MNWSFPVRNDDVSMRRCRTVKIIWIICIAGFVGVGRPPAAAVASAVEGDSLVEVATSTRQWTGIAVSRSGRVFVNFPRWSPNVPVSVGELKKDGTVEPYPNRELNNWKTGDDPAQKFVCVQSVYIDAKNRLWVLDPANPLFGGVVEGGAKLMWIDLGSNAITRTYHFDPEIAPAKSYLNDVRIETKTETAYMTDSGLGAIIVLDLETGNARRLLDDDPSTGAEKIQITIDGKPIPIVVHSDGIALDDGGGWLYYQALTGHTMYRIPTARLRDESLAPGELRAAVERFVVSGVSDGLLYAHGGIYVSALEEGSIKFVNAGGKVTTIVTDKRIVWPDSFSLGPGGSVFFTTSQINLGPNPSTPYRILELPSPKPVSPK